MNTTHRKKILFLVTKGVWGGAQRYVFDIATSLPKDRFEVVVACGEQSRTTNGEGDALPKKLAEAGIRCEHIHSLGRDVGPADIAAFREIYHLLKREQPDILHLNSSKAAALGALAARLSSFFFFLSKVKGHRSKVVFTVHGWPFNEPRPLRERIAIFFLSWLTALFSHTVITICRVDEKSGKRFLFVKKKIRLIHNGIAPFGAVERGACLPDRQAALRHIVGAPRASDDTVLIVTIAELTKNKGLAHALHACAALSREKDLPPFQYVIVGEGELRPELEKIISENNLSGIAHLAGYIPDAKTLLAGADIFLLPSLKEGLPYVLLEAGAAGIPTVATNVGGIPDIIDDMQNGMLIRAKREKEIADALRFLMTNHKKRESFGVALREKVLREFGFPKMLRETIALYDTC